MLRSGLYWEGIWVSSSNRIEGCQPGSYLDPGFNMLVRALESWLGW